MSKLKLLLILITFSFSTFAQVNDAGLWTSLSVEKKLFKTLSASLSQEFRFNENISELATTYTELGAEYRIIKRLTLGAGYRFIQKKELDDSYSLRHRFLLDLNYRFKFNKINLIFRERFQSQVADVMSGEDGFSPVQYLRSKLTVKLNTEKKYAVWIATEVFYQLNNNKGNVIDNIRYAVGIDYDFTKKHSAGVGYLINQEKNTNNPLTEYISTLSYKYSF